MDIVLLPPHLVPYLDELALPEGEPDSRLQEFQSGLEHLRGWHAFQSTFAISVEEEGFLENIGFLLKDVEAALGLEERKTRLSAIVPSLYQIVALMETVNRGRDRANFAPQPAVNDLILAGASWVQGVAEDDAVAQRLDRVTEYYKNLRQTLRGTKARLKPEVVESLEVGLEHFKRGIDHAYSALDEEDTSAMHDALAEMAEGCKVTQALVDWFRQDQERIAARFTRFKIPVVGPMLELYFESACEFPKEQWERGLNGLYRDELPKLFLFWRSAQKKIFLPPDERAAVISEVEQGLAQLRRALEIMADPAASSDDGLDAFEDSLEALSHSFAALQARLPATDHLRGSQLGAYLDLLIGAIDRFVPIVAFPEMVHSSPPPPEWNVFLEHALAYCQDGDPNHLYQAIHELLALAPPESGAPEAVLEQSWSCPYCQNSNPLGRPTCNACSRSPQLAGEGSDWQG